VPRGLLDETAAASHLLHKEDTMETNLSALSAFGISQAVTANDMANMNTPGYRAKEARLESGPDDQGVRVAEIREDTSSGPLVPGPENSLVEGSNVDLATEMVQMVRDEVAYAANAAAIRTQADMAGVLLDTRI
jgi:flagellar basal-body rod protein FlgC